MLLICPARLAEAGRHHVEKDGVPGVFCGSSVPAAVSSLSHCITTTRGQILLTLLLAWLGAVFLLQSLMLLSFLILILLLVVMVVVVVVVMVVVVVVVMVVVVVVVVVAMVV
ncbi:hypothetical protein E2C01_042768 [Portunus trituberculatus]|uniref:Uncharacterized protein n=1 Tax=Portunus trituberculatus TaxID=210409 RepID=A0A5B7FNG0_PORTR|nr:hypothetical protein [Portunus trituberculatus]